MHEHTQPLRGSGTLSGPHSPAACWSGLLSSPLRLCLSPGNRRKVMEQDQIPSIIPFYIIVVSLRWIKCNFTAPQLTINLKVRWLHTSRLQFPFWSETKGFRSLVQTVYLIIHNRCVCVCVSLLWLCISSGVTHRSCPGVQETDGQKEPDVHRGSWCVFPEGRRRTRG